MRHQILLDFSCAKCEVGSVVEVASGLCASLKTLRSREKGRDLDGEEAALLVRELGGERGGGRGGGEKE